MADFSSTGMDFSAGAAPLGDFSMYQPNGAGVIDNDSVYARVISSPNWAAVFAAPAGTIPGTDTAGRPYTDAFHTTGVNYAEPEGSSGNVPITSLGSDLMTLDPDATGLKTVGYGEHNGVNLTSNDVLALNVFGRSMSREYLQCSENGRQLLKIAENNRRGHKRNFLDAVTDFQWSDLPFVGMIASVGGSIRDAARVSDTFRKLQNGEEVSNSDLIAARLYLAKSDYREKGDWGSTVGDIIRAAPGFMIEFLATGGIGSAARTGIVGATKGGIHVGMTRGAKILARELVESSADDVARKAGEKLVGDAFKKSITKEAHERIVKEAAESVFTYMKRPEFYENLYKGLSDDALRAMAKERAEYEFTGLMARRGGKALQRGLNTWGQWLRGNVSRGLLDFGEWGTEEATVLFTGHSKAGSALADAVGTFFVEAPIRGAILYGTKELVYNPVVSAVDRAVEGGDGRLVSDSQLSLQASALASGDRALMDNADAIAQGMDLLEYISENTGRGLKSLARAGALGLENAGLKGLARPVRTVNVSTGIAEGKEGYYIGGKLRQMISDVFGSRESQRADFHATQTKLVADALGVTDAPTRSSIGAAIMSGSMDGLSDDIRTRVGPRGIRDFADSLAKEQMAKKAYARYAVANWMVKHNVGPETVMNMYDRMGYDGVFGEMFEERYNDVAKGLLGFDPEAETKWLVNARPAGKNPDGSDRTMWDGDRLDFFVNLKDAVKGLFPSWDQLTAEAVGFAMPMVAKAGVMRLQSAVGGEGKLREIRTRLDVMDDAMRHGNAVHMTHGEYLANVEAQKARDNARLQELRDRKTALDAAGDTAGSEAVARDIAEQETVIRHRAERDESFRKTFDAETRENRDAVLAVPLVNRADLADDGRYGRLISTSATQAEAGLNAQVAVVDYAPELARHLAESEIPLEGETDHWYRKAAHKIIGLAGALVTGDMSLTQTNPVQWVARDMGLSEHTVAALKNGMKEELAAVRKAAVDNGESGLRQSDLLDRAQAGFSARAKKIMTASLAASRLSALSDARIRDQAAAHFARTFVDSDSRRYQYAVDKDGNVSFFKMNADNTAIDGSTAVPFEDFYAAHKDGIEEVRRRYVAALVDVLTDKTTVAATDIGNLVTAVTLDPSSDLKDVAIYDSVMHAIGESGMMYRARIDGRTPVAEVIGAESVGRLDFDVLDYVGTRQDLGEVDGRAFESLAHAMRLPFDGTEDGLEKRNRKIFNFAKIASMTRDRGRLFYSRRILDDEKESRMSANGKVTVSAYVKDGQYVADLGYKEDGTRNEQTYATKAELDRAMAAEGYLPDASKLVMSLYKSVESEDMFHMIRELGLAKEYFRLLGGERAGNAGLHPMFRANEDGGLREIEVAEAELRKEMAAAAAGANAEPGTDGRVMWERLWGEHGYMRIGEALLARNGVLKDSTSVAAGEFSNYAPSRYVLTLGAGQLSRTSSDVYITVDPLVSPNIMDNALNAVLLNAYRTHARLFRNLSDSAVSEYLRQLSGLADQLIEEHRGKPENDALVESLILFKRNFLTDIDRPERTPDGTYVMRRGAGLTPQGFATVTAAFCLDRATANSASPYVMAAAAMAPLARQLPAYADFLNVVDISLGGAGFMSERIRVSLREEDDPNSQRGVQRLMTAATGDPAAFRKAVRASLPAGMTYSRFLDLCMSRLTAMSRTGISDADKATLREQATKADSDGASGNGSLRSHFTLMGNLVGVLKHVLKGTEDGTVPPVQFNDFMKSILEDALSDPNVTKDQRDAARGMLATISRVTDAARPAEAYVENLNAGEDLARRIAEAERARAEAERARAEALRVYEDLKTQFEESKSVTEREVNEALAEAEAAKAERDKARSQVARLSNELTEKIAAINDYKNRLNAVRASEGGGDASGETGSGPVVDATPKNGETSETPEGETSEGETSEGGEPLNGDDSLNDDPFADRKFDDDDWTVNPVQAWANLTAELPDMLGENRLPDGYGFMSRNGLFDIDADASLTRKQAGLAVNMAVRAALAANPGGEMTYDSAEAAVRQLFPHMTVKELELVMAAFRRLTDTMIRSGKTWDSLAGAGSAWSLEEDSKADESTSSDDFNNRALGEYNSEACTDFLALAKRACPETGANLNAFICISREAARGMLESGDAGEGVKFLHDLLNPALIEGAVTQAEHSALHHLLLTEFRPANSSRINGFINGFLERDSTGTPKSRRAAFLLTYLSSLPVESRVRFATLCSESVSATPVRVNADGIAELAHRRGSARVPEALITASFSRLVGADADAVIKAGSAFRAGLDALMSDGSPLRQYRDTLDDAGLIDLIRENGRHVAGVIASVFGKDSPMYVALTSRLTSDALVTQNRATLRSLARNVSAGKTRANGASTVPALWTIRGGLFMLMDIAKRENRTITADDINDVFSAILATDYAVNVHKSSASENPSGLSASLRSASSSSDVSSPLLTFMSIFQDALPDTIMRAEIDPDRDKRSSSVAIAPRGLVPILARWLYSEPNARNVIKVDGKTVALPTFAQVCRRFFGEDLSDEEINRCRQDAVWPDAARTPICAKSISTSLTTRELLQACHRAYNAARDGKNKNGVYWVPLYAGDHSSMTLIQIPMSVDFTKTDWGWEDAEYVTDRPLASGSTETGTELNVWYSSGENADFSNLAGRPFEYDGVKYVSVEHAYQTLKSGIFDEVTYRQAWAPGKKIKGKKPANTSSNVSLMNTLVYESFRQNPDAARALVATGSAKFTHKQDTGVWKDLFPKALEKARAALAYRANAETVRPDRRGDRPLAPGARLPQDELVIAGPRETARKAREIGGIDTLRHPDENGMHFGNPFNPDTGRTGVRVKVTTIKEAVERYESWLRGTTDADVEPERRDWIVKQLKSGGLVGKPLVYYTRSVQGGDYDGTGTIKEYDRNSAPNHAHVLQKLINEYAPYPGGGRWTIDKTGLTGAKLEFAEKDERKFNLLGGVTKMIAFGRPGSATDRYGTKDFKSVAVDGTGTTAYSPSDVVGVSMNGGDLSKPGSVSISDPRYQTELGNAVKAGATIIADSKYHREREHNVNGEGALAKYLSEHGYVEVPSLATDDAAVWVPGQPRAEGNSKPKPKPGKEKVSFAGRYIGDNGKLRDLSAEFPYTNGELNSWAAENPISLSRATDELRSAANSRSSYSKPGVIAPGSDLENYVRAMKAGIVDNSGRLIEDTGAVSRAESPAEDDGFFDGDLESFADAEGIKSFTESTEPVAETKGRSKPGKEKVSYTEMARATSSALGLSLMFTDTKRSAVSSLEAEGTGMIGAERQADGTVKYGENRIHIGRNWEFDSAAYKFEKSDKNAAFLGSTYMYGYGATALKRLTQDRRSATVKAHVISTGGADLFFAKSLSIATSDQFGVFPEGSSGRMVMDYLRKFRGDDRLSTDFFTDYESYKIGPAASKSLKVLGSDGKEHSVMDYVFDRLYSQLDGINGAVDPGSDQVKKAMKARFGKTVTGAELDDMVGGLDIVDKVRGNGTMKLSDILPGAAVTFMDGFAGPTLDLSYREDGAMAYPVANVSHDASIPHDPGPSPRNYEVDAMAMAATLTRWADSSVCNKLSPGLGNNRRVAKAVFDLISNWGLLANSVYSDPLFLNSVIRRTPALRDMLDNGESPDGLGASDQLARQAWAAIRQAANLPMYGIDAPLVSSGAVVDDDGKLFMHTGDPVQRAMMRGSELFNDEDAKFYGCARRMAFCNANVNNPTFRYTWFFNGEKFTGHREELAGLGVKFSSASGAPSGRTAALDIAAMFTRLRDVTNSRAAGSADDVKNAARLRELIADCFTDHHGLSISGRRATYFGFDDLFLADLYNESGEDRFDLSAVLCEEGDLIDGKIALQGTMFGLPRTPSYNGSMWLQTVRAGLPVTEDVTKTGDTVTGWTPGYDAMVQPDPYTNKILGCDHDGDKTKMYMLHVNSGTGRAEFTVPPDPGDGTFRRDDYLAKCREGNKNIFELHRINDETGENEIIPDDEAPKTNEGRKAKGMYYEISSGTRRRISNSFVRALFNMSRALPTAAWRETGPNSGELVPRGAASVPGRREKFIGGVASSPTKAFPVANKKDLTTRTDENGNVVERIGKEIIAPDGSLGTLGDPVLMADVSSSAADAGDGRAMAVSWARTLHMAWTFGFDDYGHGRSGLFGKTKAASPEKWLAFMYRLDGLSNAMFDDIKEQMCSRLGWTKGMMDTVVSLLIGYAAEHGLPVTDHAFASLLGGYSENVKNRGKFYWAMKAVQLDADAEDRSAIAAKARAADKLLSNDKSAMYTAFYTAFQAEFPWLDSKQIGDMIVKLGGKIAPDDRGDGKIRGLTVESGMMYYLMENLPAEGQGEALKEAAKRYVSWYLTREKLAAAREFGTSVNYLTADPGAPNAVKKEDDSVTAYNGMEDRIKNQLGEKPVKLSAGTDLDMRGVFRKMHTATVLSYNIGQGVETISARAAKSARPLTKDDREYFAATPLKPLLDKRRMRPWQRLDTEASVQQLPYLCSTFDIAGNWAVNVGSKGTGTPVRNGADLYDAAVAIADGIGSGLGSRAAELTASIDSYENANPEFRANKDREKLDRLDRIRQTFGDTFDRGLRFRHGVEGMFKVMYNLMATSTEFGRPGAGNKAIAYLYTSDDSAYGTRKKYVISDDDGFEGHYVNVSDYGSPGNGLSRITARFAAPNDKMAARVREMFGRIITGEDFGGSRELFRNAAAPDYTVCRTFTLTPQSIADYVREYTGSKNVTAGNVLAVLDTWTAGASDKAESADRAKWAASVADAFNAVRAYMKWQKDNGREPVGMTPAVLFGQFLPLRAVMTDRVSAMTSDRNPSYFSMMPREYYAMLSASEARLSRANRGAMDLVTGCDWSPVQTGKIDFKKSDKDKLYVPQGNPEFRHFADILGDDGFKPVLDTLGKWGSPSGADGRVIPPEPNGIDVTKGYDRETANMAAALGGVLGAFGSVEYTGGKTFTFRGKLRGRAGDGKTAVILFSTGGFGGKDGLTDESVDRLAHSRMYANSLCNAAGERLSLNGEPFTADDFMALPLSVRKAMVRKYGIGGGTRNTVEISVNGKGLATLIGAVRVPAGKNGSRLYHEYFHAIMRIFEAVNLFSDEDYARLARQFGIDKSGKHRFDEEAAAEGFRKWVDGKLDKNAETTTGIFRRIYEVITGFIKAIGRALGLDFTGRADDERLFKMALYGFAEPTNSKIEAVRAASSLNFAADVVKGKINEAAEKAALDKEFTPKLPKTRDGKEIRRPFASALERAENNLNHMPGFTAEFPELDSTPEWANVMRTTQVGPEADRLEKLLVSQFESEDPVDDIAANLRDLVDLRSAVAAKVSAALGVDLLPWFDPVRRNTGDMPVLNGKPIETSDMDLTVGENEARDAEVEAAVDKATGTVPLTETNDFYHAARWIDTALENGLKSEGSWQRPLQYIVNRYNTPHWHNKTDEAADKAAIVRGLRRTLMHLNPEAADKLSDATVMNSLAFEAALRMYRTLENSFVKQALKKDGAGHILPANPVGDEKSAHASMYQVSAWLLSVRPATPARAAHNALEKVTELRMLAGDEADDAVRSELNWIVSSMQRLEDLVGDGPSGLTALRAGAQTEEIGRILWGLRAGTESHGYDKNGFLNDVTPVKDIDKTDNWLSHVQYPILCGSLGNPVVQSALKTALTAAWQIAAQVKFMRELDIIPASMEDYEFQQQMSKRLNIPEGVSLAEWAASQAIGDSNLVDNRGLVDYMDQPYFIANNTEAWLSSLVRKSFGAKGNIGEMMSAEHNEYGALKSMIAQRENLAAYDFGDNVEAGGEIFEMLQQDGKFAMEEGAVVHKENSTGKWRKYDVYNNRKVRGAVMTERYLEDVDWFKKMCKAHAAGQTHIVTGVDGLTFHKGMNRDASYYSVDEINARRKAGEQLDSLSFALYRMTRQLPPSVLSSDHDGSLNLYSRFVDSAIQAMTEAEDELPAEKFGAAQYNALVIRKLRDAGMVAGVNKTGVRYDVDLPAYTSAVVTVNCDEVNDMFLRSDVYAMLTDPARGNRPAEVLSRDHYINEMMDVYRDTVSFVRKHPWLVHGDGKYFNSFGTMLPFWRGSGVFMYNANRVLRSRAERLAQAGIKMDREARAFKAVLDSAAPETPVGALDPERTFDMFRMLSNLYHVGVEGPDFVKLIEAGEFEPGRQRSNRSGLVLNRDATLRDVASAIYSKCIELAWDEETGRVHDAPRVRDINSVISAYEESMRTRGELFGGHIGLNDMQMVEKTGTLPANYQLGHAVHVAIDGLTNAMMARSTMANLLMTPAWDGAPVYYADPSSYATETSGLTDGFWQNIAQWWSEYNNLDEAHRYDPKLTGVQNAKRIFEYIKDTADANKGRLIAGNGDHSSGYMLFASDKENIASVDRWLVRDDDRLGEESSLINALAKGEAMGYLRHFLAANRVMGMGGSAVRAVLHRAMSWSKSMSVSFSWFFPIATKWESPIGALGSVATISSNIRGAGRLARENPELFARLQDLFPGRGWITKDFLGFSDILDMMDSNDPFLAEMYSWANALGVSMSTSLVSPMEDAAATTESDIRKLKSYLRGLYGAEVAGKFGRVMDMLMKRHTDKAFNYALNATKLACIAQLNMKLRHAAQTRGKAFDPVRDLRRYAGYINAEIGGIDPLKYAWAHPMNRAIMNDMMFSWQWTRGAWEAGGGGVIEDLLFGGHSVTRQEREFFLGRWVRMFGAVMIGAPQILQIATMIAAKCLGVGGETLAHLLYGTGGDDDLLTEEEFREKYGRGRNVGEKRRALEAGAALTREEFVARYGRERDDREMGAYISARNGTGKDVWFTWQNESKARWTAADITPLLKAVDEFDDNVLQGGFKKFRRHGTPVTGAAGAAAGAALGLVNGGNWLTGFLGAVAGGTAGAVVPSLVPIYTGDDPANSKTRDRRYYMHFGKQGWEFFRWFEAPRQQAMSKLSMPLQRSLEVAFGRSLSYLERSLPWEEMGPLERWLAPTKDSATFNLALAFLPFSVSGMSQYGDAGILPMVGPVQMGASQTAVQKKLVPALEKWARNDRGGYRWGGYGGAAGKREARLTVIDILRDAARNGYDPDEQLKTALGQVAPKFYEKLVLEFAKDSPDDVDPEALARNLRALNRLGATEANLKRSVKNRLERMNTRPWDDTVNFREDLALGVLPDMMVNPFAAPSVTEARMAEQGGSALGNFLATDKVPDTVFGIPVVQDPGTYTEEDLEFFNKHPNAGGYYQLEGEE